MASQDTVEFQIKLIDMMTKPARDAERAMGGLQKQLKQDQAFRQAEVQAQAVSKALGGLVPASTTKSVAQLQQELKNETKQLRELQAASKRLQGGSVVDIGMFKQLETTIAGKKESIAGLQGQLLQLGNTAQSTGSEVAAMGEEAAVALPELAAAAAAILPVIAVIGAIGVGLYAGSKLAIQATEAKEDTLDMLQAMLGSQQAAQQTFGAIDDIERDIGLNHARALDLAQELSSAGIKNQEALTNAIQAIGQVEAVLPKAGAEIEELFKRTAASGTFKIMDKQFANLGITKEEVATQLSEQLGIAPKVIEQQLAEGKIKADQGMKAIAAVIDAKYGELAKGQALDFDKQLDRLQSNIHKLFDGVDLSPLKSAFHDFVMVFDKSSESGKAFKFLVTKVFDEVMKVAGHVLPYITTFMKGLAVIGLKVYIALKPLFGLFGGEVDTKKGTDALADGMSKFGDMLGGVITKTIEFGMTVMENIASIRMQIQDTGWADVGFRLMKTLIKGVGMALLEGLVEIDLEMIQAGESLVDGLTEGIQNAAGSLVDAVKDMAKQALGSFTDFFDMHSPSRVMADMGANLTAGLAMGINDTAMLPSVAMNDTVSDFRAPPSIAAGGSGDGGRERARGAGGAPQITFSGPIYVNGTTAETARESFYEGVQDVFEQLAAEMGGAA